MIILLFFLIHWYLSVLIQSFFLHRYASHQMFTMSLFSEKCFFILMSIIQGSSYIDPKLYVIIHRLHHVHTDEKKDPHSPLNTGTMLSSFIQLFKFVKSIKRDEIEIEKSFYKNIPYWKKCDVVSRNLIVRLIWIAFYSYIYFNFTTHWSLYFLLPLHFIMTHLQGGLINWYAHKIGYTNFCIHNSSTNILPFDFIFLGEGYHNNHHKYQSRSNFGKLWFEIDITYSFILVLNHIGIIQMKK